MLRCPTSRGQLAVEVFGPADAPPVLLVCGGGSDRQNWARMIPELCRDADERAALRPIERALTDDLRVAVFDQAGVGDSVEVPPPMTALEYAEDSLAVGRLALGERFAVAGMSLGGIAALQLALAWPEVPTGLVLACTVAGLSAFATADPLEPIELASPPGAHPRLVAEAADIAPSFSRAFPERERDMFWHIVQQSADRVHAPESTNSQIGIFVSHDVVDRLGEITVPVRVLCGTEDGTFCIANSRFLADRIAGAELEELDGVGHAIHHEAPERLAATIRSVVRRG